MNRHYSDILALTPDPPKWWDEMAVPRYCDFAPSAIADVYADECCLMRIACQNCRTEFLVCLSANEADGQLLKSINNAHIQYGDPPNNRCCSPGISANSEVIEIVEYWQADFSGGVMWLKHHDVPEVYRIIRLTRDVMGS